MLHIIGKLIFLMGHVWKAVGLVVPVVLLIPLHKDLFRDTICGFLLKLDDRFVIGEYLQCNIFEISFKVACS